MQSRLFQNAVPGLYILLNLALFAYIKNSLEPKPYTWKDRYDYGLSFESENSATVPALVIVLLLNGIVASVYSCLPGQDQKRVEENTSQPHQHRN